MGVLRRCVGVLRGCVNGEGACIGRMLGVFRGCRCIERVYISKEVVGVSKGCVVCQYSPVPLLCRPKPR